MADLRYETAYDPYAEPIKKKGEFDDLAPLENDPTLNLPFRFTEFAINPMAGATSGREGRTAVARSPYTSGSLYSELQGLRSQLNTMGDIKNPGDAPNPEDFRTAGQADGTISPEVTYKFGLPTMQMELPQGLILGNRTPLSAAYEWQRAKGELTPEQLAQVGPMGSIEAFDMRTALGDEYNTWFGGQTYQGSENQATQRMYQNLSMLPTSVDPRFDLSRSMYNLASKDFSTTTDNGQVLPTRDELASALQRGEYTEITGYGGESQDIPQYTTFNPPTYLAGMYGLNERGEPINPNVMQVGGLSIDPTGSASGTFGNTDINRYTNSIQEQLMKDPERNENSGMMNFVNRWLPSAILGGMSYGLGSGLGAIAGSTVGAGSGAAAGAASGLAGAAGMTAGFTATTVNTLASMIATYGAAKAAEMAGLDMSNPMMIAAMGAAGGFASGYSGAGINTNSNIGSGVIGETQIPDASGLVAPGPDGGQIITSGELTQTIPNNSNVVAQILPGGESAFYEIDPNTFQGFSSDVVGGNNSLTPEQRTQILKYGMGGLESYLNQQAMPNPDPGAGMGLAPEDQIRYDEALREYNTQLDAFNRYSDMQKQWDELTQRYSAQQALMARERGLLSDIMGNISGNPYYTPTLDYTGPQSQFV